MVYAAVLVLIILALLGVSVARTAKLRTHADFMVAGRKLSPVVLVFTLLCSWIGAGSLFGGAEFAYHRGLASLWLPAGGWAGLLVVYFIAGRARAFAQYTVPDLLETRYSPLARVLGTLCIIVSYTAIVSYQFRGGGRILNLAFGIDEAVGTVILAGFVILFTALAGMSSVAYTDLVIGLLVTAGAVVTLPVMFSNAGGWSALRAALPESHFQPMGGMTWVEALGYFLPTFTLMMGNQSSYQKFFSARSESAARISVVGWIAGTVFLEIVIVLLAMVGGVMYHDVIESGSLPAWGIIPYTARHGVVPWVGAIFLGAVFAKVISTGNNYLFSPATNVVHDIFHRTVLKGASDRTLLVVSRIVVVVLGLMALAQSFQPSILATAVYAYDVYGAGITPAVVATFFWKRATTAGGLSSICAGTGVAVAWKTLGLEAHLPMIFPALAASLACLIGVSLLTAPPREEQWRPFFRRKEI
ncbi:MAG: sodium:solute symporter family protein [Acidobacteria bacterium]|nr:sodium:solute symporter family protein [Acidobacteriota bacterium]